MLKLIAIPLALSVLFCSAQTSDSATLEEVVVTGSRTQLKQSQTGKVLTVINEETLRNNTGKTLTELLNTQAAIFINGANNAYGSNIDMFFRGSGSGNFLLVIDGIPVYDASEINSTFDLNHIALDQVERIEILKGGQSTLWGSNAVAGVIQVFLKKGSYNTARYNITAAYGSYNTSRVNVGINAGGERYSFLVNTNYVASKGFSAATDSLGTKAFDKDGFRQVNLLTEFKYKFSSRFSTKLFTSYNRYNTDLDAAPYEDDRDFKSKNTNVVTGLSLQYHYNRINWTTTASYQSVDRTFTDDSTHKGSLFYDFAEGNYKSNTINVESFSTFRLGKSLQLVSGLQYLYQSTGQRYISIDRSAPAPWDVFEARLGKDSANITQLSAYSSFLYTSAKGFNFEAGGRLNHHSLYSTHATYTLNPSYNIDNNTRVFLNISTGYKIPSLYQLFSEYGNRNLKPERSTTYEVGVATESTDKRFFSRFVAFRRDIKNMIAFFFNPTTFESFYINRDEQNDHGFEWESRITAASWAAISTNLAFVDGKGIVDNVKMANLYRRPKFTLSAAATLKPAASISIIPAIRYVGARDKAAVDYGPAEQPEYYMLDCYFSYQFTKLSTKMFLDLRNITAQQYFDIPGYSTRGFNFMAGVSVNF